MPSLFAICLGVAVFVVVSLMYFNEGGGDPCTFEGITTVNWYWKSLGWYLKHLVLVPISQVQVLYYWSLAYPCWTWLITFLKVWYVNKAIADSTWRSSLFCKGYISSKNVLIIWGVSSVKDRSFIIIIVIYVIKLVWYSIRKIQENTK